jgi:hypothetical protein
VVIACMLGSSESWVLISTHIHGTHVPVEEPSTASLADVLGEVTVSALETGAASSSQKRLTHFLRDI